MRPYLLLSEAGKEFPLSKGAAGQRRWSRSDSGRLPPGGCLANWGSPTSALAISKEDNPCAFGGSPFAKGESFKTAGLSFLAAHLNKQPPLFLRRRCLQHQETDGF